jgi:NADPH:quinone reductase-like Zn-dependent oxidoreductase
VKTWQLEQLGRENLHLVEIPEPTPGPNEILVRANAFSLNFRDKAIIEGSYVVPINFPLVPGSDLAGEVVSVGADVTRFKVGDKVVSVFQPLWLDGIPTPEARAATLGGPLPGVLAEYVLLSEAGALTYPRYLTPAQASTLPITAVTAWVALFEHGHLQPEETVLVQGSGGVSLFVSNLREHSVRVSSQLREVPVRYLC